MKAVNIRSSFSKREKMRRKPSSLRADLADLLTCFRYPTLQQRKAVRTTNAIERRFREVRRPARPMGTIQDKTSMDRILFAVFMHGNRNQGLAPPLPRHRPFDVTHERGPCERRGGLERLLLTSFL